jgi:glutamate synthase (NADPH) small chain
MTQKTTGRNPLLHIFDLCKKLFKKEKSPIQDCATWQDVPLYISEEANKVIEMRHVLIDEIKQVIFHAETTGEKLYQPDGSRYLGKLRIGKATFYVEYAYGKGNFIVNTVYYHRSEIAE